LFTGNISNSESGDEVKREEEERRVWSSLRALSSCK